MSARPGSPCGQAYPSTCLLQQVPAGTQATAWHNLNRTFGCCLRHHLQALGLMDNYRAWSADGFARLPDDHSITLAQGFAADPMLLSLFSMHRYADAYAIGQRFVRAHGSAKKRIPARRPLLLALNSGEGEAHSLAAHACIDRGGKRHDARCANSSIGANVPSAVEAEIVAAGAGSAVVVMLEDIRLPLPSQVRMLDDPRVAGVYVTNAAIGHPRLHMLPIGVHSPNQWGACLRRDEIRTKNTLLMCDCLSSTERSRSSKIAALRRNGFSCATSCHMGPQEYCAAMLRARFVASPHGNGQHNHREIEAWTAGAIPILDHDQYDEGLYAELPRIVVRNWSTVTPQMLEHKWQSFLKLQREQRVDLRSAYFPFWLHRLFWGGGETLPRTTLQRL